MRFPILFTIGLTSATLSDMEFEQQKTRIIKEVDSLRILNHKLINQISHYREQLTIYQVLYEREAEQHKKLQADYKELLERK